MESIIQNIAAYIKKNARTEGQNLTNIPYLIMYRHNKPEVLLPDIGGPFLYFVIEGTLRLNFVKGIKDYLPGQYLLAEMVSPKMGQALSVSSDKPFLALSVSLTADDVISVLLDIDGDFSARILEANPCLQPEADKRLLSAILRLLEMEQDELSFMGKHLKREVIFHVLCGPLGKQLIQNVAAMKQVGDIYSINNWIKENYKTNFTVEELAGKSNMSVSSFHQNFKNAVGMGPLQCQKQLRLLEARRLMLDKGAGVTEAALEVGYESVSQFTREYRRMFGQSPHKDVKAIKESLMKK